MSEISSKEHGLSLDHTRKLRERDLMGDSPEFALIVSFSCKNRSMLQLTWIFMARLPV